MYHILYGDMANSRIANMLTEARVVPTSATLKRGSEAEEVRMQEVAETSCWENFITKWGEAQNMVRKSQFNEICLFRGW